MNYARLIYLALIIFTLGSRSSFSFTLTSQNPFRYSSDEVFIDFTNDDCSNTGFTRDYLFELSMNAVNQFWNGVSTSRISFIKGTVRSTLTADGFTSVSSFAQTGQGNHILIGCNDDISSFSSGGTIAVGNITQGSSGNVYGGVIINDHANSLVGTLDEGQLKTMLAHEVGHAIGLGHSTVVEALMYFSVSGKNQERLAEDDYDGISYLYPLEKKLGGLGGSCGTVELTGGSKQSGNKIGSSFKSNVKSKGISIVVLNIFNFSLGVFALLGFVVLKNRLLKL